MKITKVLFVLLIPILSLTFSNNVTAQNVNPIQNGLENKPQLEKKIFIHYKKGYGKPDDILNQAKTKTVSCYQFLAKGLLWKTLPINLYLGTNLPVGVSESSFVSALTEWDDHTGATLFGNFIVDSSASWDSDKLDYRNEIVFGSYPNDGVIAITITWGYFSGPVLTREITEFDILFNNHFSWGNADPNPALMDVQNIATHELGHGLGLSDLYQTACSPVTMFGYSTEGDVEKRTLEPADITGIQKLYGI